MVTGASARITTVFNRFSHIHQLMPIRGSLGPPEFTSQMASGSLQPFLKAHDCDTDTQTDHAMCRHL